MITPMSSEELTDILSTNSATILIDVRDPEEFYSSHLEGAESIPLAELGSVVEQRYPDKSSPIVLYCDVGIRSHHAARLLRAMGYHNVKEIQGGMASIAIQDAPQKNLTEPPIPKDNSKSVLHALAATINAATPGIH